MNETNDPFADSTYGNGVTTTGDPAVTAAVFVVVGIIALICYVVMAIFMGMIFKKAGIESWKAWVPFYNQWVFLELGGQKGWLALLPLLYLIPIVGTFFLGPIAAIVVAVFAAIAAYRIGLNFGKDGVFVLLYIFLSPVWFIWLAVDKTAVWKPVAGAPTAPSQPAAM